MSTPDEQGQVTNGDSQLTSLRSVSRGRRVLNWLGVLFLLLVVLELALRLTGWAVALSVEGRRDDDASARTVVCVGDSWTQGRETGRYPEMLEERLNARGGGPWRVINLGRSGTNSSQALRHLEEHLDEYQPEIVIVMTGNNDHWNLTDSSYHRFAQGELGTAALWTSRARIAVHSLRIYKLGVVIKQLLTGGRRPHEFFYREAATDDLDAVRAEAVDLETHQRLVRYNLVKFVELSRVRGFHLAFGTYFHFHGYKVNEIIRDTALSYGLPLADGNLRFHEIPVEERGPYVIPDGHPSPMGYGTIADHLISVMDEAGWLDEAS